MLIYQNNRESRLDVCLQAAGRYLLSEAEAVEIIKGQVAHILENWRIVCDEAELTQVDRNLLWRRQFLNNLAFEGSEDHFADFLRKLN